MTASGDGADGADAPAPPRPDETPEPTGDPAAETPAARTDDDADSVDDADPSDTAEEGDEVEQDGDGEAGFMLQLPAFEGPLDLLLHLIERQELDITELSVLQVTEQYLTHLRSGDQINLTALAEFVAMGARLLLLKSRALLAPSGVVVDGEDEDAAGDLVAALQEYRRYRRAAEHLRDLEDQHRTAYRREAAPPEVPLPSGLDDVTLDGLVDLFREVLERLPEEEELAEVEREPIRLADRISSVVARLEREPRLPFRGLIAGAETRLEVIVDFMAVLELIKLRFLEASQPDAFGEIELVRLEGAAAPSEETEAFDDF
ncbi:MAG: ScpA family protein [Dehalococcoidia bacterium]|nr:ScpA family protein [Dehalococcoidia bacterium]